MTEWHITPDYIVNNWTDELFELMVDKLVERKKKESNTKSDKPIESEEMFKESRSIIARFCNVGEVKETKAKLKGNYADAEFDKYKLQLNLDADKELKEEWEFTELRRRIQALRKEAELMPDDKVKLVISCNDKEFLEKYAERIEKETNTKIHASGGKGEKLLEREFSIKLEK